MDTRITSAVVGCGRMGAFTSEVMQRHAPSCWFPLSHVEAILQHDRLALSALCDVDAEALRKAAAAYGITAVYTDMRRLIEDVRPGLLGVATRTAQRAQLISLAIGAGVRALHVEKPLCNSVRELADLCALMGRSDVFVTYGTIRRFFAAYRSAKRLSDSGRYGPLREIRVNMGSGALFWTHPHSIDLILYSAGSRSVVGVQARLADVVKAASPLEIESDPKVVVAAVYFDDGVVGHITQSLGSDLILSCADAEIVVRADGGTLEIYSADHDSIYPQSKPFDGEMLPAGPGGTLAPLSLLVACLDGDPAAVEQNAIIKRDVLRGQQIAFAMLQSHLEGSRIVRPEAIDPMIFVHARTGNRHA